MEAAGRLMNDAGAAGKPVVVPSIYANVDSLPLTHLREGGVPVTSSLEIACRCAEVVVRRRDLLLRAPVWARENLADRAGLRAPATSPASLTEWQAREELSAYGARFAPGRLVRTKDDLAGLSWDAPFAHEDRFARHSA